MQGSSMMPTLREGQRVAVRLEARDLDRGDLLLFRQVDYLVVHRLLGTAHFPDGRPCLRTRGDGRPALDPPVDRGQVRGKVVAIEGDGYWWDLQGGGAKAYGLGLAMHDFFWAAAAVLAGKAERVLQRLGITWPARAWIARLDSALLTLTHQLLFKHMHSRIAAPPDAEEEELSPSGQTAPP